MAVVEGRTADDVLCIYGGDPNNSIGEFTFAQLSHMKGRGEPYPIEFNVILPYVDQHVVAVENDGYSGSIPEIARRCSANGGRFFSVYWNVNAFGLMTQAVDGEVTAYFEHLYPFAPEPESNEIRPDWAIGPELDVTLAKQACLALMEQQTGLAFDPFWLNDARPAYRIPDPHSMLKDVEGAERP